VITSPVRASRVRAGSAAWSKIVAAIETERGPFQPRAGSPAKRRPEMSIDRIVLVFAGSLILISTILAVTLSAEFLILTAFVGMNLLQSAFTGFCPLAKLLKRAGLQVGTLYR
jgi:hypothetical protein